MQSHAVRCNHMQSHAITCDHMQSHAITCCQVQSHAITCNHMLSGALRRITRGSMRRTWVASVVTSLGGSSDGHAPSSSSASP